VFAKLSLQVYSYQGGAEMTTKEQLVANLKSRFPSRNKNKRAAAVVKVSKALGMHLAHQATILSPSDLANYIRYKILPGIPYGGRGSWYEGFRALCRDLDRLDSINSTARSIFILKGNKKLPFVTFSELPIVTCPGRGPCAEFCYTFVGWRSPLAFLRQLYNTVVMLHRPDLIRAHFMALPRDAIVRLYVDGDFTNARILTFWLELIAARPDLAVYGYSKSWALFAAHTGPFPDNYRLNVSSGSRYGLDLQKQLEQLTRVNGSPLVRGVFAAVSIDMTGIDNKTRYQNPLYHSRVREAILAEYGVRGFSCPGECGECVNGAHACNNSKFQNVVIGIGIHGGGR